MGFNREQSQKVAVNSAKAEASGLTRWGRSSKLMKEARKSSAELLGLSKGVKNRKLKNVIKGTKNFMKSNDAKRYQKNLEERGLSSKKAKEMVRDYGIGISTGKTRLSYKSKKRDRAEKSLAMTKALGYNGYKTAKTLKKLLKKEIKQNKN